MREKENLIPFGWTGWDRRTRVRVSVLEFVRARARVCVILQNMSDTHVGLGHLEEEG